LSQPLPQSGSDDEDAATFGNMQDLDRDFDQGPIEHGNEKEADPYGSSFWGADNDQGQPKRTAPWRSSPGTLPQSTSAAAAKKPSDTLDDSFSFDDHKNHLNRAGSAGTSERSGINTQQAERSRWDADAGDADLGLLGNNSIGRLGNAKDLSLPGAEGGDTLADPFGDLGGFSSLGKKGLLDDNFDIFGSGGFDMDNFGGGRGKGKGKGKRDPMAPREPNPKQVFVAQIGDMPEEDIRMFFEETGEVDRLKVLQNPDGSSKGVCFVTFRTEEQAQKALTLHGTMLEGRSLVVRLAHGGNKGGGEKGDRGFKGGSGPDRGERLGNLDGPLDLGAGTSERFGALFGDRDRERDRNGMGFGGGKGGRSGKGTGFGGRRNDRGELDDLLEEALSEGDGPVKLSDFDFAARRFLGELRTRDKSEGTTRFREAMDMVLKYTSSKDRTAVRKWPAYIFTLLQKFDPNLSEELRERDAERRREKGSGGFGGKDRRFQD